MQRGLTGHFIGTIRGNTLVHPPQSDALVTVVVVPQAVTSAGQDSGTVVVSVQPADPPLTWLPLVGGLVVAAVTVSPLPMPVDEQTMVNVEKGVVAVVVAVMNRTYVYSQPCKSC